MNPFRPPPKTQRELERAYFTRHNLVRFPPLPRPLRDRLHAIAKQEGKTLRALLEETLEAALQKLEQTGGPS